MRTSLKPLKIFNLVKHTDKSHGKSRKGEVARGHRVTATLFVTHITQLAAEIDSSLSCRSSFPGNKRQTACSQTLPAGDTTRYGTPPRQALSVLCEREAEDTRPFFTELCRTRVYRL